MTKKDSIFKENPYQYLLTKLRKFMKKEDIKVITDYSKETLNLRFKRDFWHDKGEIYIELGMTYSNEITLNVELHSIYDVENEEIFQHINDYLNKVAKKLKVIAIMAKKTDTVDLEKYGFQDVHNILEEGYPTTIIGSGFFDYDKELLFYEVERGKIQERLDIFKEFKNSIEKLKNNYDETFQLHGPITSVEYSFFSFYYEGAEGIIKISFLNPLAVSLYDERYGAYSFDEDKIIKSIEVTSLNKVFSTINTLIEDAIESQGFLRLTNPPKKHFKKYCDKYLQVGMVDEIFELLSSEMNPKEIELAILKEKETKVYTYERKCFFKVLNKYFVSDLTTKKIYMYHTVEEGVTQFEYVCKKSEEEAYLLKLKKIKEVRESIPINI